MIQIPPPYPTIIQTNHGARIPEEKMIFFLDLNLFFDFFPGFFFVDSPSMGLANFGTRDNPVWYIFV